MHVLVEYDFSVAADKKYARLTESSVRALGRYHAALSYAGHGRQNYVVESYPFGFPMFVEGQTTHQQALARIIALSLLAHRPFPAGIHYQRLRLKLRNYIFGSRRNRGRAPYADTKAPVIFVGIFEFTDWVTPPANWEAFPTGRLPRGQRVFSVPSTRATTPLRGTCAGRFGPPGK